MHLEFYVLGRQNDIAVLAVNLQRNKSVERARSVQRNFVKALIEDETAVDSAIVAFYSDSAPEKWRLSFVQLDHEFVAGRAKKLQSRPRKGILISSGKMNPARRLISSSFRFLQMILPLLHLMTWKRLSASRKSRRNFSTSTRKNSIKSKTIWKTILSSRPNRKRTDLPLSSLPRNFWGRLCFYTSCRKNLARR